MKIMNTLRFVTLVSALTIGTNAGHAAGVDFESVPLGTTYAGGYAPGDLALSQAGVDVTLETFFFLPAASGSTFNEASIVAAPNPFSPNGTQALATNNINAMFHLPGPTSQVSIEFADYGGNENFDINGMGIQSVPDLGSLVSPPGFNVSVASTGPSTGVLTVTQTGATPITSLLIGGQEFGIDNLRAVPEPSGLLISVFGVLGLVGFRRRNRPR